MNTSRLLLLYAALNAILYSALLPLWEGFDEPFHFAYVQQLANLGGFPDARTARLSRETGEALLLAPASASVKLNLPGLSTFDDFFSRTPAQRKATRAALRAIPSAYRWQSSSQFLNYEAQQAPLAYLILALPERIMAPVAIPARVLYLRLICALAGAFLLWSGTFALCTGLGLAKPFSEIAVFCVFSSQMTWATIAHVANDWLAVPLAVWTLVFLIRGSLPRAALILGAGLLTKGYFLALVPMLFGLCLWCRKLTPLAILLVTAGPWYLRNWLLYNSLLGRQEERSGIGLAAVLHAAPSLNWTHVIAQSVRAALWTGNNSFRTFSLVTTDLAIALCAAALLMLAFTRHRRAEWIAATYCCAFTLALAYASAVVFISLNGRSSAQAAWYSQVLVAPLLTLALLGASRAGPAGKALAMALAAVFGYMLVVTYLFKLIPLYAGYEGRTSLSAVTLLYRNDFAQLASNLGLVSCGPPWLVFTLTAAVLLTMGILLARFARGVRVS